MINSLEVNEPCVVTLVNINGEKTEVEISGNDVGAYIASYKHPFTETRYSKINEKTIIYESDKVSFLFIGSLNQEINTFDLKVSKVVDTNGGGDNNDNDNAMLNKVVGVSLLLSTFLINYL